MFSLNKNGHFFLEFGMLPNSLNIPMQRFAKLCISSQFACAEIGDNDIHEKLRLFKVISVCTNNDNNSLSKFLWIIMTRLSKMERERTVGMIHAETSKTNVKTECKFENLKIDPCVKSLTLKRKR